jgi:hypothetical protein
MVINNKMGSPAIRKAIRKGKAVTQPGGNGLKGGEEA